MLNKYKYLNGSICASKQLLHVMENSQKLHFVFH